MFITIYAVLFVFSISVFSEAAFVDTIKKCSSKDEECLKTTFRNVFNGMGGSGVSELGIPPFDPLIIKDQTLSILNLIDLKVQDGTVTGVKNCNVDKFAIQLDKGKGIVDLTCDLLIIEGKYQLDASSPIFKDVLGSESVHGDGSGNIKIEKLHFKLDIPIKVQKRDGDIYLQYDFKHVIYEYEVLGKVTIYADNLSIGGKESSKETLKFFNDNWKLMLNAFGKPLVEKSLNIAFGILSKFFDFVPAKYYLSDNLSSY